MDVTIKFYQDQHRRALDCASKISDILTNKPEIAEKAGEIRLLLAQLSGTLKPHLKSEDMFLYPILIASEDESVGETASRFWDEMGAMTGVITGYMEKWREAGAIEADTDGFSTASEGIFAASNGE